MKTLFIPAKVKVNLNKEKLKSLSKKLPENIAIAYSIQFKDLATEIKSVISNKITQITQVLGCSKPNFSKKTQAILLIGSGRFHALSLASETNLPIYILERDKLSEISQKEIESFQKKKKASYLKFLHADSLGILISTKPGQENLKNSLALKNKIKDKKSYFFMSNSINPSEFENFSIDSWVNTACPRLDMDSSPINTRNLELKP
jgi:diphthamide biosynthesis enzyme Dph1/Dph2-like protein